MQIWKICAQNQHILLTSINDLSVRKRSDKEIEQIGPVIMLRDARVINLSKLPLTDGKVHFIRRVDNDEQINVMNETFGVGKEFTSEYVWATICLRKQRFEVYYRAQNQDVAALVKKLGYDVNEEIRPIRDDIWKI